MFQSIRNFFRDAFFGKDELPDVIWSQGCGFHVVHEGEVLTSAELQQLQRIVSELLRYENSDSRLMKYAASRSEKGTEQRAYYFKEYRKSKVKMKKLSALQYRLKHRIVAKG